MFHDIIDRMPEQGTTNRKHQFSHNEWGRHYSRIPSEVTIFGSKCDGIAYDYSDRLAYFDYERAQWAHEIANMYEQPRTAAWADLYLSALFGRDCTVRHIISGYNLSDGYPYQVYGYTK